MSDAIISIRDMSKVYRLYKKPHYRFLDMFGMLGKNRDMYSEHIALHHINLEVAKGEKVAIIGRNGAGKSTLLKLITGVMEPTSGSIEISQGAHALLQIGTGFHPEFTGRHNAVAFLAHLGVFGTEAERKIDEIIDFAELEEYIDQPVKTYSSGMMARLMFATSTAIEPELLILDEILGVGDAYFANKSYERMRELCAGAGTTLLLVTHDIYSASRLCERIIWIDRGRIIIDGDGPTVVKAYEDSIREQEERRLRGKKFEQLRAVSATAAASNSVPIVVEIKGRHNRPQPSPVYFSRITLLNNGSPLESLPLGTDAFDYLDKSHLDREAGCWGEIDFLHGRQTRPMLNYGSSFHKVSGAFIVSDPSFQPDGAELELLLEYWSDEPCDLVLRCFVGGKEIDLGALPAPEGGWAKHVVRFVRADEIDVGVVADRSVEPLPELNTTGVHGSSAITVTDVKMMDEQGNETHFLSHGKPADLLIHYNINRHDLRENAQVLVAFKRDGVHDVCRIITRELVFDAAERPCGVVRMHLPRVMLANGTYSITIMVVEEGYFDREQAIFYSINPGVYASLTKVIDIVVVNGGLVGTGTEVVAEACWSLEGGTDAARPTESIQQFTPDACHDASL